MKRWIFMLGVLILSGKGIAQVADPSLQLPDSISLADAQWVDFDNDGLLDISLMMKTRSDKYFLGIIKGDTVTPLSRIEQSFPVISSPVYFLTDYNRDNAMDVVISGEKNNGNVTAVYLNKGGFEFEEIITTLPVFEQVRFADLNNDATPEMIASGEDDNGPYCKILKQNADLSWTTVNDSLKINCISMEVLDADGDGDLDLFVSGTNDPDSLLSGFLINKGSFYFTPLNTLELAGNISSGDLNGDGFFDIILMAKDLTGQWHSKKYQSNASGYTVEDVSPVLKNGRPFIADFNYDGIADLNYHGITASGDTVNMIHYSNGETDLLPRHQLISQRFGDLDHKGNLHLLTLRAGDFITVALPASLRKAKNDGPRSPTNAVALPVFNRVFMYWEKPADDHTAESSLTFDVHLDGTSNYHAGEFDLLNEKRLTVTHGNNGTENFKLLKRVSLDNLQFAIQAIDNSFHAGRPCIGAGGGGGGQGCAINTSAEEISACSRERLVLESPPEALWFSFAKGFLGVRNDFEFSSEAGDTLFYYNPAKEGCPELRAWAININDDTLKIEKNEKFSCSGSVIQFTVEPGWKNITWVSQVHGPLGSSESIQYQVTAPDSVSVTMSNIEGCKIIRKTAVRISAPSVKVAAENYKVMKGGEVQLQAAGAQRYTWTPATGLNDPSIPNPVAIPVSSVQYTVTGYDSLDCTDQAVVAITVEQTGFVPNLFSPNDDGQNDQLKIYGVVSAQRFTFSIYDREGALVYKTSDVSEAVQQGWDGTKNGTKQPPGVYFWKVKGEIPSGQLMLNGKDSGSIVLIR